MALHSPFSYHVFISFRGQDTRYNFAGNLYKALLTKESTPTLLKAIQESRIAIIVLSPNYAASCFCLEELIHILHCIKGNSRLVLPVFYEVDPSVVRHLKNSFGEAIAKHEKRYKDDMNNKVDKWKESLHQVTNLSGYDFKYRDGYEHKFIGDIVENISKE